jgi:hypothetical protein
MTRHTAALCRSEQRTLPVSNPALHTRGYPHTSPALVRLVRLLAVQAATEHRPATIQHTFNSEDV